jgi:hypothetical protein
MYVHARLPAWVYAGVREPNVAQPVPHWQNPWFYPGVLATRDNPYNPPRVNVTNSR